MSRFWLSLSVVVFCFTGYVEAAPSPASPTTLPTTRPALTPPATVADARSLLEGIRLLCTDRLSGKVDYQRALKKKTDAESKLDEARFKATPEQRLQASTDYLNAKTEYDALVLAACRMDSDYVQAEKWLSDLVAQERAKAEAARAAKADEDARARQNSNATANSTNNNDSTGNDGGNFGNGTTGNNDGKTVHVKGYTRKDGTVVQPYNRRPPRR